MKTFCLVLVLFQCFLYARSEATNEIDPRIINGQPANLTEIYYQVSVQYGFNATANFTHICGGTVINSKTVLTAAQCLYDLNNKLLPATNIRVVSGTLTPHVNNSGTARYVSKIVAHSSFKPNSGKLDYDVAVLRLSNPFPVSNTLRAIEMNTKSISDGTRCVISGFGTNNGSLARANVAIIKLSTCKSSFASGIVTKNMICAGVTGSNICVGDGGGPLVCDGKVAGIASFAASGCNTNLPGVYTDVSKFTSWVVKNGASPSAASLLTIVFATLVAYLL